MAQNADNQDDKSSSTDEAVRVTEEDLFKDKYGDEDVESSNDDDETSDDDESADEDTEEAGEDDGKTDDGTEEDDSEEQDETDSDEDDSEFVKQFPNIKGDTLVDYARNLESTISESNKEGKRLFDENEALKQEIADLKAGQTTGDTSGDSSDTNPAFDPNTMYVQQRMQEDAEAAFGEFRKQFPQVEDPTENSKFIREVETFSRTILQSQNRLASPKELYSKAAASLGWEPTKVDGKDRLKIALKDRSSTAKTASSGTSKKAPKSKVTDAMIKANRLMFPNKTDDQIRKELEPYVK